METQERTMQIFRKINELEQLIHNSPSPRFGGGQRRLIDPDELLDILGDIKITIPEDIRRANSVLVEAETITSNAEAYANETVEAAQARADKIDEEAAANGAQIVDEAKARAAAMIAEAEQKRELMLSEHEVTLEAQRRAELLCRKAEYNARLVYENAKQYADGILDNIMRFMEEFYDVIKENRRNLGAIPRPSFDRPPEEVQPQAVETARQNESDNVEDEDEGPTSLFDLLRIKKKKKAVQTADDEE